MSKGLLNVNIVQKERVNLHEKNWIYPNKIKVILGTLFFIFLLGGTYIYSQFYNFSDKTYRELERGRKSIKREHKISPLKDNIAILIMEEDNSETREGEYEKNARSDALVLMQRLYLFERGI
ncbi:TPA: hypothetical protein ACTZ3H_005162 [Bacillus cereus]|uniref:hypothetical protein n=1 Tax=Bacillus cereus group TaxID=86661 RepID=UPI001F60EA38|nr:MULTISPECIES: hypothetical protein [Bacillus cereus group]MCU5697047.1 hypothetical protein [Bacillus cereus]